jgi:hypothetical protein
MALAGARLMNCPKCDADVSDTYEPDDHSVGINAGWYCDACDLGIGENEYPRDAGEHDVYVPSMPRDPSKPLGTPISQVSGRPGTDGFAEWCRISRSWGFD